MKRLPVRKLTLTAMLICIVFVQEELLSFIPNVQLTVFLIFLYGAVCGPFYGTIIVIIHVFLDNLVMGTMIPQVMIPMTLGWEITMLLGYLSEKLKLKLWLKCLISGFGSLAYCLIFALFNTLFLKVGFIEYILADIPFEVVIFVCSIVTVMFLYDSIYKLLNKKWKGLKTYESNENSESIHE